MIVIFTITLPIAAVLITDYLDLQFRKIETFNCTLLDVLLFSHRLFSIYSIMCENNENKMLLFLKLIQN